MLSSSSTYDKKSRLKRACDSCRRSKIKCNAAERYPQRCSNCVERRECTFLDGAPKEKHMYAYVKSLEERVGFENSHF